MLDGKKVSGRLTIDEAEKLDLHVYLRTVGSKKPELYTTLTKALPLTFFLKQKYSLSKGHYYKLKRNQVAQV